MYVNRIDRINIPDFIEAWDRGYASVDNIQIKRSKEGNLNSLGDPLSSFAPVVTKHHPLFFNFVEEGIQALVKKLSLTLTISLFLAVRGIQHTAPMVGFQHYVQEAYLFYQGITLNYKKFLRN